MELLYDCEFNGNGILSEEESRHCISVMRHKKGDVLHITNGKGYCYTCLIDDPHPKRCKVSLQAQQHIAAPSYSLHMAVAPTKNIDRFEWFLEKAVELGIQEITPIWCDHGERNRIRAERLEKILISAMKQSLKFYLPKLHDPLPFKEWIAQPRAGKGYILHCRESEKQHLFRLLQPLEPVALLIGPEGDFSVAEIEMALQHGFREATLGNKRLRTETAALAACHLANLVNEM